MQADGLVIDLFAGGGGASAGIAAALGREPDIAINHDPVALAVHRANHAATLHLDADIWEVRPREATKGRRVGLLWASPDCTHFSVAKGGKPRKQSIRSLAWVVVRWAKEVRPDVICVENVQEFRGWGPLGPDGLPDKARMGETFARWRRALERLGYVVDHRVLDASLYGAPTRRRRLFLMARCDGLPIRWPEPTHGPGRAPLHTAAECIDWGLPCPSIFDRKRPLAEKTLWRVAQGIRRFVFEAASPFIVKVNHGGADPRGEDLGDPLTTVTAQQRGHALVSPSLVQTGYGEREGQRPRALDLHAPLGTLVNGQKHALVSAFLAKHFGDPLRADGGGGVVAGSELGQPIGTVTARDHHSLAALRLEKLDERYRSCSASDFNGCDRGAGRRQRLEAPESEHDPAGRPASPRDDGEERLPGGSCELEPQGLHDVGSPSGVDGAERSDPGRAGDQPQGRRPDEQSPLQSGAGDAAREHAPLIPGPRSETPAVRPDASPCASRPGGACVAGAGAYVRADRQGVGGESDDCVSSRGHVADVRAFLTIYYGSDGPNGQQLTEPLRTITARHRLGLVTVSGVDYQIVDIGLRMLEPHELLRAQFGRFAADYDLSAAKTKKDQIRLIGNSVCPEVAEALIRANCDSAEARAA